MKKSGFTLIELIVVIGLLALVTLIVGANFVGLSQKQKVKEYDRMKEKVVAAARLYVGLNRGNSKTTCLGTTGNGSFNLSINTLVNEGLIDEETLFDPRTENKDPISLTKIINVKCTSGDITYVFPE